jgi:hypothetical protein
MKGIIVNTADVAVAQTAMHLARQRALSDTDELVRQLMAELIAVRQEIALARSEVALRKSELAELRRAQVVERMLYNAQRTTQSLN